MSKLTENQQRELDGLCAVSPTIARLRQQVLDDEQAALAAARPKSTWSGGLRPNRGKRGSNKPSRVQTHLALCLQRKGDD